MVSTYNIRFRFRTRWIPAYVQVYDGFCLVNVTDDEVLQNFTSQFHFTLPDKKFIVGHHRSPAALDLHDLVMGIRAQLH